MSRFNMSRFNKSKFNAKSSGDREVSLSPISIGVIQSLVVEKSTRSTPITFSLGLNQEYKDSRETSVTLDYVLGTSQEIDSLKKVRVEVVISNGVEISLVVAPLNKVVEISFSNGISQTIDCLKSGRSPPSEYSLKIDLETTYLPKKRSIDILQSIGSNQNHTSKVEATVGVVFSLRSSQEVHSEKYIEVQALVSNGAKQSIFSYHRSSESSLTISGGESQSLDQFSAKYTENIDNELGVRILTETGNHPQAHIDLSLGIAQEVLGVKDSSSEGIVSSLELTQSIYTEKSTTDLSINSLGSRQEQAYRLVRYSDIPRQSIGSFQALNYTGKYSTTAHITNGVRQSLDHIRYTEGKSVDSNSISQEMLAEKDTLKSSHISEGSNQETLATKHIENKAVIDNGLIIELIPRSTKLSSNKFELGLEQKLTYSANAIALIDISGGSNQATEGHKSVDIQVIESIGEVTKIDCKTVRSSIEVLTHSLESTQDSTSHKEIEFYIDIALGERHSNKVSIERFTMIDISHQNNVDNEQLRGKEVSLAEVGGVSSELELMKQGLSRISILMRSNLEIGYEKGIEPPIIVKPTSVLISNSKTYFEIKDSKTHLEIDNPILIIEEVIKWNL